MALTSQSRHAPAAPTISDDGTVAATPDRRQNARRGKLPDFDFPTPPDVPVWLDRDVADYLRVKDVRTVQRMRKCPRPGEFDLRKAVSGKVGHYWRWDAATVRKIVRGGVRVAEKGI